MRVRYNYEKRLFVKNTKTGDWLGLCVSGPCGTDLTETETIKQRMDFAFWKLRLRNEPWFAECWSVEKHYINDFYRRFCYMRKYEKCGGISRLDDVDIDTNEL